MKEKDIQQFGCYRALTDMPHNETSVRIICRAEAGVGLHSSSPYPAKCWWYVERLDEKGGLAKAHSRNIFEEDDLLVLPSPHKKKTTGKLIAYRDYLGTVDKEGVFTALYFPLGPHSFYQFEIPFVPIFVEKKELVEYDGALPTSHQPKGDDMTTTKNSKPKPTKAEMIREAWEAGHKSAGTIIEYAESKYKERLKSGTLAPELAKLRKEAGVEANEPAPKRKRQTSVRWLNEAAGRAQAQRDKEREDAESGSAALLEMASHYSGNLKPDDVTHGELMRLGQFAHDFGGIEKLLVGVAAYHDLIRLGLERV